MPRVSAGSWGGKCILMGGVHLYDTVKALIYVVGRDNYGHTTRECARVPRP